MPNLDDVDRHILMLLQENGRIPNNELADHVGIAPSTCLRRVRALEAAGVIDRYVALLDPVSVGSGVTVFARVWLTSQRAEVVDGFVESIMDIPEVVECHFMGGEADFLLRIVVADLDAYRLLQREQLSRIESVQSVKTEIPLQKIKLTWALPV